jgi:hypothetical protein
MKIGLIILTIFIGGIILGVIKLVKFIRYHESCITENEQQN